MVRNGGCGGGPLGIPSWSAIVPAVVVSPWCYANRRWAMDQHETAKANASSAYVPTLQRTEGQPPPIAANGGLSYMAFERDGDAGTTKALDDALALIAKGDGQRVVEMID